MSTKNPTSQPPQGNQLDRNHEVFRGAPRPETKAMPPQGRKDDQLKARFDLISPIAEEALAEVLTHGAAKYGDRNWEKGIVYSRLLGAAKRHINAFEQGVDVDPDSGLHPIDHAFCNLMMLAHFVRIGTAGLDDRPEPYN